MVLAPIGLAAILSVEAGRTASGAIAADLNARGIAAPNGGRWFPMQTGRARPRLGITAYAGGSFFSRRVWAGSLLRHSNAFEYFARSWMQRGGNVLVGDLFNRQIRKRRMLPEIVDLGNGCSRKCSYGLRIRARPGYHDGIGANRWRVGS